MDIETETFCPVCGYAVPSSANFCSQCGAKIHEPPFSISIAKQALVYFVSFFLAPFGLGYAFKYFKIADVKARRIGVFAILLTVLGIATVIFVATKFTNSFYAPLNSLDSLLEL